MGILQGFLDALVGLYQSSGLATLAWQNYVMILISIVLLYLAIKKEYEPMLLLPIAFGMLLVNLYPGIMEAPTTELIERAVYEATHGGEKQSYAISIINGVEYYNVPQNGGLFYYLYLGPK